MMRLKIVVCFLLMGCVPEPGPELEMANIPDECNAEEYLNLLGKSQSVLANRNLPESVRILGPDTVVTMDYSPSRLNIFYNEEGKIVRIRCG